VSVCQLRDSLNWTAARKTAVASQHLASVKMRVSNSRRVMFITATGVRRQPAKNMRCKSFTGKA
jgi:hypothetical protein